MKWIFIILILTIALIGVGTTIYLKPEITDGFLSNEDVRGFTMPAVTINSTTERKVLSGRQAIDDYRRIHDRQYVRGVKVIDYEGEMFAKLINNLTILGFKNASKITRADDFIKPLQDFFNESKTYNLNVLGFNSEEDFLTTANDEQKKNYSTMWR